MADTDTDTDTDTDGDTDTPAEIRSFADFGIDAPLCDALTEAGITEPFPIQELTLPMALSGADVIGQARTGTGKTLAFGLPLLQRVDPAHRQVQALVIVPTRELCVQVTGELEHASARLDLSLVALYGGRPIEPQAQALADGAHVVVGTPGRLLDLHQRGMLDLSGVATLVLDEADEMLDLGFLPDVEQLIGLCPAERQTLLFSATMPSPVVALARRYMTKPTFVRAEEDRSALSPDTTHCFLSCHRLDKPAVLARILQSPDRGLCVVFTRTKRMADQLGKELADRDVDAAPIHSDLRQDARERALRRFRDGKVTVLVATEVAARGLDIDHVTHVVNYDCPDDEKMYLHRIGRTGRAGAAGAAITLAVWNELARLEMIKKALSLADEPTHEVFSTSPLLDELFNLPPAETRTQRAERATAAAGGGGAGSSEGDAAGGGGSGGGAAAGGGNAAAGSTRQGEGGNRRRRRGGRGGRGGASRSDRATAPAAGGAPASDGPTAPAGATGDSDAAADARPAEAAPAATSDATGEVPAARPGDADHGDAARSGGGHQRSRTRTRSRNRGSAGDGQPQRSGSAGGAGSADRSGSRQRGEGPRSGGSSGTAAGSQDTARSQDGDKATGQPSGPGKRSSSSSRRGGKRQSGRSAGAGRRPAVSAAEARGAGRPRIRRPLQVDHLP